MANNTIINQKQRNQAILEFGLMYLISVALFGYVLYSYLTLPEVVNARKAQSLSNASQSELANMILSEYNEIFDVFAEADFNFDKASRKVNKLEGMIQTEAAKNININQTNLSNIDKTTKNFRKMLDDIRNLNDEIEEKKENIRQLKTELSNCKTSALGIN